MEVSAICNLRSTYFEPLRDRRKNGELVFSCSRWDSVFDVLLIAAAFIFRVEADGVMLVAAAFAFRVEADGIVLVAAAFPFRVEGDGIMLVAAAFAFGSTGDGLVYKMRRRVLGALFVSCKYKHAGEKSSIYAYIYAVRIYMQCVYELEMISGHGHIIGGGTLCVLC